MLKYLDFTQFQDLELDLLIDARTPAEYAHAHIKNARNLPSLTNAQHEEVGTLYKSDKQAARTLGACFVCENIQGYLRLIGRELKLSSKIGIYCARGGQRSKSQALILDQIGYKVYVLEGGYKAYRSYINRYFEGDLGLFGINLCGKTGVGKSELLEKLQGIIDLEGAANHLGSSFGGVKGAQPSQKSFEDDLFWQIKYAKSFKISISLKENMHEKNCVFIEAESSKIGKLQVPKALVALREGGLNVWCECKEDARIKRIKKDYKNVDLGFFEQAMKRISPFIKKSEAKCAKDAFLAGDLELCIKVLLNYYDKTYKKPVRVDFRINTDDLELAKKELCKLLGL